MYQPTIDSHFAARHTHVQIPFGALSAPDAALAGLGAQILASRPDRTRSILGRLAAHIAATPVRPTHAPAR